MKALLAYTVNVSSACSRNRTLGVVTNTASRCFQCLGVRIERHLDMTKQVSHTISACSFYMTSGHLGELLVVAVWTFKLNFF